jgi:hypothetical protein
VNIVSGIGRVSYGSAQRSTVANAAAAASIPVALIGAAAAGPARRVLAGPAPEVGPLVGSRWDPHPW